MTAVVPPRVLAGGIFCFASVRAREQRWSQRGCGVLGFLIRTFRLRVLRLFFLLLPAIPLTICTRIIELSVRSTPPS